MRVGLVEAVADEGYFASIRVVPVHAGLMMVYLRTCAVCGEKGLCLNFLRLSSVITYN